MRLLVAAPLAALAAVAACSSAPIAEPQPAPRPTATAPAPSASESVAEAAPDADGGATDGGANDGGAVAVKDEGPRACADGMTLVDGDYCTDVEQKCLKSWYDKSNKKTICEQFEHKTTCVGQHVKKRYCIDDYEWPNQKGVRPEVMNYFYQAEVKCASAGKRMCTESEWTLACEGPEMKPYPYGYERDPEKCNGDHMWDSPDMKKVAKRDPKELARLWHGVPSGSQAQCISDYGVSDLPGNADEVVANEHPKGPRYKFDSTHTGGPWYKGVRNQCRPKIYTHNEDFYYYFLSFRCCAEPDGKATDPRTPRQIKDGWKFEKVEHLAQFSVAQMKGKLDLKKEGKCTCAEHDILCKTMCGTLLGPGAVDGTTR